MPATLKIVDNGSQPPSNPPPRKPVQAVAHFDHVVLLNGERQREGQRARFARTTKGLREHINRIDATLVLREAERSAAHEKHRASGFEKHHPAIPAWIYNLILVAVCLFEAPIVVKAFEMFGLDDIEKWLAALGVAILNYLAAILLGRFLRHAEPWARGKREILVLVAVATAVGGVAWALASLRQAYVSLAYAGAGLASSLASFISLQAFFFIVAVALSFFAQHPDRSIDQAIRNKNLGEKRRERLLKLRARLAARWNASLRRAEARLAEIEYHTLQLIAEYRLEVARLITAPAYFTGAVTREAFLPIHLGEPVDPQPKTLDQLIETEKPHA
jgi:hypothetical protein